ncbi:MAG: T9SS type A sorting domain-containing protein [Mariniphaga sp.]|nr:T9SS type A sorting domain-containing protein [Mariniphaga sp.]
MKRRLNLLLLILFLPFAVFSARIISQFEIARWYLDADLVIVCSVQKIDTIFVSRFDSLKADGFRLRYEVVQEKYSIVVDSVLKKTFAETDLPEIILTPQFPINFSECRITEKIFTGFDENGDSVFLVSVECMHNYYDDSYFRIDEEKHVVFLNNTEEGQVISYSHPVDSILMDILITIEEMGESYFNIFWAENLPYVPFSKENAQWNIYLERSISEAPVDTVLLRYFLCGDTTVNQLNYKKLWLEMGSLANPVRELAGLIREQDKRIYYQGIDFLGFPHYKEWLLYDFDVQEGDTVWHIDSGYDYTVIEKIDSVIVGSQLRRRYKVNTWRNYYFKDEEFWVEGIGSIKNGLLGHITDIPTCCYHFWEFVCYSEKGATKYLNPSFDDCYPSFLFSSTDGGLKLPEISIYPNPANDFLIVENVPADEVFRIKMFDLTGRQILDMQLLQGRNTIDIRLFDGIMVVAISDATAKVIKRKKVISGYVQY